MPADTACLVRVEYKTHKKGYWSSEASTTQLTSTTQLCFFVRIKLVHDYFLSTILNTKKYLLRTVLVKDHWLQEIENQSNQFKSKITERIQGIAKKHRAGSTTVSYRTWETFNVYRLSVATWSVQVSCTLLSAN